MQVVLHWNEVGHRHGSIFPNNLAAAGAPARIVPVPPPLHHPRFTTPALANVVTLAARDVVGTPQLSGQLTH